MKTQTKSCPACGMSQEEWTVHDGKGVRKKDKTYCCEGCASGQGCTCPANVSRRGYDNFNF